MKIYCITSPNTELVYVGKTSQTLALRINSHRANHKRYLSGKTNYCSSYKVIEFGGAIIELIEETDDESREAHWIKQLGACNQHQMEVDWSDKASRAEYDRKRKMANRDEINRKQAEQIPCDHCGRFSSRVNMQRHKRGKRCLDFVKEPVLCLSPNLPLLEQPTV